MFRLNYIGLVELFNLGVLNLDDVDFLQYDKEIIDELGVTAHQLANNYGLTMSQVQGLGYNIASTSGDPHIFPLHGDMYELPHTPGIYRLLQGDDLIVNASTRNITDKEKNHIMSYFESRGVLNNENVDKIVNDGVFYEKIFVSCDGHEFTYDFDLRKVTLEIKQANHFSSLIQMY